MRRSVLSGKTELQQDIRTTGFFRRREIDSGRMQDAGRRDQRPSAADDGELENWKNSRRVGSGIATEMQGLDALVKVVFAFTFAPTYYRLSNLWPMSRPLLS